MSKNFLLLGLLFAFTPSFAATQSFAVIGDAGKWNENSRKVRDSIRQASVQDLVLPGDNIYSWWNRFGFGSYNAQWLDWEFFNFRFSVVAIGNHNSGYGKEISYFKMPGEYYSKAFGTKTRFIVLNSDNTATAEEQAAWFSTELASIKEPCVFVVFHHPPVTLNAKHHWTDRRAFQESIRPLILNNPNRISAVLVAHDHIAQMLEMNSIPLLVSGGVHQIYPAADVNENQMGIRLRSLWAYKGINPHWLKLSIDEGKEAAEYSFIDAATQNVSYTQTKSCK